MAKLKIVKSYDDVPSEIQNDVERYLTDDILERYDNSKYHNEDIIHNTLAEHGYKLQDNGY